MYERALFSHTYFQLEMLKNAKTKDVSVHNCAIMNSSIKYYIFSTNL